LHLGEFLGRGRLRQTHFGRGQCQLNAVERMLATGYDCPDLLMQLVSARRAIKALSEKLIHSHMRHCIEHAASPDDARRKLRDLLTVLERDVD
jgi:DNA-binding FrmR family transcriptional regulator